MFPDHVVEGDGHTQWRIHYLDIAITIPDGVRLVGGFATPDPCTTPGPPPQSRPGCNGAGTSLTDLATGSVLTFSDEGVETNRHVVESAGTAPIARGAEQSAGRSVHDLFDRLMDSVRVVPLEPAAQPEAARAYHCPLPEPAELIVVKDAASYDSLLLEWTGGPANTTAWQFRQRRWEDYKALAWDAWTDVPNSGADTRSYRLMGLREGTAYDFEVRAVVDAVAGEPSSNGRPRDDARAPGAITHRQGDLPRLGAWQIVEGDGRTEWQLGSFLFIIPDGVRVEAHTSFVAGGGTYGNLGTRVYVFSGGGLTFYHDSGSVRPYVYQGASANMAALLDQIIESVTRLDIRKGSRERDFPLRVGDCLQAPPRMDFSTVTAVPCSDEHSFEIIAAYSGPSASRSRYIGEGRQDRLHEYARELCVKEHFAQYVGVPYYDQSWLGVGTIVPTAEAWSTGDREFHCYVFAQSGKLTDSVRGRGR